MSMFVSSIAKNRSQVQVFNPQKITPKTFASMFTSASFIDAIKGSFKYSEFNLTESAKGNAKFTLYNIAPLMTWQKKQDILVSYMKRFFSLNFEILEFPSEEQILKYFKKHPATEDFFGTEKEFIVNLVAKKFSRSHQTPGVVSQDLMTILYSLEARKDSLKNWDSIFSKLITALKDCAAEAEHQKLR